MNANAKLNDAGAGFMTKTLKVIKASAKMDDTRASFMTKYLRKLSCVVYAQLYIQ